MPSTINRVAVFGVSLPGQEHRVPLYCTTSYFGQASGNFGRPITTALLNAGFQVTAIGRRESASATARFSPDLLLLPAAVIKIDYHSREEIIQALAGQDAAVIAIGPLGIHEGHPATIVDACRAAGSSVRRVILDDFGWGPDMGNRFAEFAPIHASRKAQWDHVMSRARDEDKDEAGGSRLTWTGVICGNPIDWALKKFPLMGFDIANQTAIIYDEGEEHFTGTTLEGIGQSVVGIFRHLDETANRFVKVMSIKTCQKELLKAFNNASAREWDVRRTTSQALIEAGREQHRQGDRGWILSMVVAQLYDKGQQRSVVAPSRDESDSDLLGVIAETPDQVVRKALG